MTTIAEQVNEVKAAAASRLPAEVVAVFESDQAALAAGGVPAGAVVRWRHAGAVRAARRDGPGPDAGGANGGWSCRHRLLPGRLVPVLQRYASYLPTGPSAPPRRILGSSGRDLAGDARCVAQHAGEGRLTYTVLSDTGVELASSLGLTFEPSEDGLAAQRKLGVDIRTTRADGGTVLPMPTVLIVDRDRVVRFVDIHPDYTGRTEVADILAALQTLPS